MYAKILKGSYATPCKACGEVHNSACEAEEKHVEKGNPNHGPDGRFVSKPVEAKKSVPDYWKQNLGF